jgi:hypothetical protein
MKKKFAPLALIAMLVFALFALTGCGQCEMFLCSNNARMFRDYCRTCQDIVDALGAIGDFFR